MCVLLNERAALLARCLELEALLETARQERDDWRELALLRGSEGDGEEVALITSSSSNGYELSQSHR